VRLEQAVKQIERQRKRARRLRIGGYRVIQEIDEHQRLAIVLHTGHRRDVRR